LVRRFDYKQTPVFGRKGSGFFFAATLCVTDELSSEKESRPRQRRAASRKRNCTPDYPAADAAGSFAADVFMIAKRALILSLVLLVAASGAAISLAAPVADKPIAPGGPDLKTMLEKGLRARRPSEFAFIQRVVKLVNQGKLPIAVVETSFLWARPKRPYPMPYFMETMEVRAKKVGIDLKAQLGP
jgi:hypothetical protein